MTKLPFPANTSELRATAIASLKAYGLDPVAEPDLLTIFAASLQESLRDNTEIIEEIVIKRTLTIRTMKVAFDLISEEKKKAANDKAEVQSTSEEVVQTPQG